MRRYAQLLLVLCAGCASAAQHAYVAPTNETIMSETEDDRGPTPAHVVYVSNHSTVPIQVYSIRLYDCTNVKQRCDVSSVNITVGPGQRKVITRVEPASAATGFGYRFGYSWKPRDVAP
jgi:uncharacterized protein YcfL